MAKSSPVDQLLAESERLRAELRRTSDRLEDFTRELLNEVNRLRTETAVQPQDDGDEEVSP